MKNAWLNYILHLSSYVYRAKNDILKAGVLKTVYLAFYIILLEFLLFILSLPTYFLFPSANFDHVKGYSDEMKKYRLHRTVTLTVIISVLGILLAKVVLAYILTVFSGVPVAS